MLDQFTADTFAPLIDQEFHVVSPGATEVLTLREVERTAPRQGFRQGFLLLFEGANRHAMMPQGYLALENTRLGRIDVLVTPTMPAPGPVFRYQVVFG